MSRIAQADILMELVELSRDVAQDLTQQLSYYRASVYKEESATDIAAKIDQLRMIATLFGDPWELEPFRDYEAMIAGQVAAVYPGECLFSRRVSTLLSAIDDHLNELCQKMPRQTIDTKGQQDLTDKVKKHRRELLAICRQGSRQWAFFQTL